MAADQAWSLQGLATVTRSALGAEARELLIAAETVRPRAYAPYSSFLVGAALRTQAKAVLTGVNMENASYGLSLCAEAAALARCVTSTGDLLIEAMAVVGGAARAAEAARLPTLPCGRCRQLLLEAVHRRQADIPLYCAYAGSVDVAVTSVRALLPFGFGPLNLPREP